MGPWDYLKYLAGGAKPVERPPLKFTPMQQSEFARLTDPTQDPKVGPGWSYDPKWQPIDESGEPITGRVPTWSDMRPTPVEGVPRYEGGVLGGDPEGWRRDLANLAIKPEEVEWLTRSQEKRDAAVKEAVLTRPDQTEGWDATLKPFRPMMARIGPALTGAIGGGIVGGPVGALVGGFAGGFAGSEMGQTLEERERQTLESDLPQYYDTPAYAALQRQLQNARQEHSTTASVLEGAMNALPLGALRETRFLPRVLKEAGRGAGLGAGSTALLAKTDPGGVVPEGVERGEISLPQVGMGAGMGAAFGGGLGAFAHLVNRNAPPTEPPLTDLRRDFSRFKKQVGLPLTELETYVDSLEARRISERPNPPAPPKPPFYTPISWEGGEEPPPAAFDIIGRGQGGSQTPYVDYLKSLTRRYTAWQEEQARSAANVKPPDAAPAPAEPAPSPAPAGPKARTGASPSAVGKDIAALERQAQALIAQGGPANFAKANDILAEVEKLKTAAAAGAANSPEAGVGAQGRILKPSPGAEEDKLVGDLFAGTPAETPAGPVTPPEAAPVVPSGVTDADVDELSRLLGVKPPMPAAAPVAAPPQKPVKIQELMNEIRRRMIAAYNGAAAAAEAGDMATANVHKEHLQYLTDLSTWIRRGRIGEPPAEPQIPAAPTPVAGVAPRSPSVPPPPAPGTPPSQEPVPIPAGPTTPPMPPGGAGAEATPPPTGETPLQAKMRSETFPILPKEGQPFLPNLPPEEQGAGVPTTATDTLETRRLLNLANQDIDAAGGVVPPKSGPDVVAAQTNKLAAELLGQPEFAGLKFAELVDLLNGARVKPTEPISPRDAQGNLIQRPGTFVQESPTSPQPGHVQMPLKATPGGTPPPAAPRGVSGPPPAGMAPKSVEGILGQPAPASPAAAPVPAQEPIAPMVEGAKLPSWKAKPQPPIQREGAIVPLTPMQGERERIAVLDPRVIGLDPATYQFKGSDAEGWTGSLAGAKAWAEAIDPNTGKRTNASPAILVHRRADGTLWVADGHQRYGLYKRLWKDGKDLLPLVAEVIDEAEGWTVPMVRRYASVRNVMNGSADVVDIAKLIRAGGELSAFEESMIPTGAESMAGPKYRTAQAIAKLGDDAFQAVVNGQTKPEYAAIVPTYFTNQGAQNAVIAALAKKKPESIDAAEALVLGMRDGLLKRAEEGAQLSMFDIIGGKDAKFESLLDKHASLIAEVRSGLKSQRSAFQNALKNAGRLEEAGNVLAGEANKALSDEAKQLLLYYDKYKNLRGSHTNRTLIESAQEISNGTLNKQSAVQRVYDALRRDIETGGEGAGNAVATDFAPAGQPDVPGSPAPVQEPVGAVQPAAKPAQEPVAPVAEAKPPVPVEVKPPEPVPDMEQPALFTPDEILGIPPKPEPPKNVEGILESKPVAPVQAEKPQNVEGILGRDYKQSTPEEYRVMREARDAVFDAASLRGLRDRLIGEDEKAKALFPQGGADAVVNYWKNLQSEIEQAPLIEGIGTEKRQYIKGDTGEYALVPQKGYVQVRFKQVPSKEQLAILKEVRTNSIGRQKPLFKRNATDGYWYGNIEGDQNQWGGFKQDDLEAAARRALGLGEKEAGPVVETPPPAAEGPKSAAVKMMLTVDERQQLADLGYSRADIDAMKPDEGAAIIAAGTTKPLSAPVDVQTKIGIEPTLPGMAEGVGAPKAEAPPLAEVPFALQAETGTGEPVQQDMLPKGPITAKPQTAEQLLGSVPPNKKKPDRWEGVPPHLRQAIELHERAARGEQITDEVLKQYPDYVQRNVRIQQQHAAERRVIEQRAYEFSKTHEVTFTPEQIAAAHAFAHQSEAWWGKMFQRLPNKPDMPETLTLAEAQSPNPPQTGKPQRTDTGKALPPAEGFPSRVPQSLERKMEAAIEAGDFEQYQRYLEYLSEITFGTQARNNKKDTKLSSVGFMGTQVLSDMLERNPKAFWNLMRIAVPAVGGAALDDEDPRRGFIRGALLGLGTNMAMSANVRAEAARVGKAIATMKSTAAELQGAVKLRAPADPLKDMSLWSMYRPGFFEKNAPEAFARYLKVMDEYNYMAHYGGLAEAPERVQQYAARQAIHKVVTELRAYAKEIEKAQPRRAAYVREGADALAKKPTKMQLAVKEAMSPIKEVDNAFFERNVGTNIYRVLTGYAVSTALQNLTQPILSLRHVQLKDLAWAYSVANSDWAKSITKHIDIHRPMDLAEEAGVQISKKTKEYTGWKKWVMDPHAMLMESDKMNRRVVYLAAMKQAERRGLMGPYQEEWSRAVANKTFSEAFRSEADKWARGVMRETQGDVGPLSFNPNWRGPIGGSIKPFMKFPTLLVENLMHSLSQPDKTGRARFLASVFVVAATGRMLGIDFEDILLMGGRPMGIDITDPKKTVENWATGQQFPVVRVAQDIGKHWRGEANHVMIPRHLDEILDSDALYYGAGRWPTQTLQTAKRTYRSDIEPTMEGREREPHMKRTPSGAANELSLGEDLANLLGFKSTRQTKRARELERATRTQVEDQAENIAWSKDMARRIRYALDNKDWELLDKLVTEYNERKRSSKAGAAVIKAAQADRFQRLKQGSSKDMQRQLEAEHGEALRATALR